jgi:hypothetical protein
MNEILINIIHVDDYFNFIIIKNIITINFHYHTIYNNIIYILDLLMHVNILMVKIIYYLIVLYIVYIDANFILNLYMVYINLLLSIMIYKRDRILFFNIFGVGLYVVLLVNKDYLYGFLIIIVRYVLFIILTYYYYYYYLMNLLI